MVIETKENIEILGDKEMDDKLLTVQQVAEKAGVSEATVLKEIKIGKLLHHKVGRQYRIEMANFDDWISGKAQPQETVQTKPTVKVEDLPNVRIAKEAALIAEDEARKAIAEANKADAAWRRRQAEMKLKECTNCEAQMAQNKELAGELEHRQEAYEKAKTALAKDKTEFNSRVVKITDREAKLTEQEADLADRIKKAKKAKLFSSTLADQLAEAQKDLKEVISYVPQIKSFKQESDYILPRLYHADKILSIGGKDDTGRKTKPS